MIEDLVAWGYVLVSFLPVLTADLLGVLVELWYELGVCVPEVSEVLLSEAEWVLGLLPDGD